MDVGTTLQQARLSRGLTLQDLAAQTRIRAELLAQIERNDFTHCGGEVYARGHVRTLAQALGLDAEPLTEAMGGTPGATVLAPDDADTLNIWDLHDRAHDPHARRWWSAGAGLVMLVALVVGWQALSGSNDPTLQATDMPSVSVSPSATSAAASPSSVTATTEPSATPTPTTTAAATPPEETAPTVVEGALVLELSCSQTSWVRISNARGTLYEGTMRAGDRRALSSDSSVTVRIGNASGVALTVNGTEYGSLGAPGEVYTHTFRVG